MCLIIHKPIKTDRIPADYIDNAKRKNADGFGITYTDTFETIRTMDYALADKLLDVDRPYVAHFRYATRGEINEANCHPFDITTDSIIYSNGTVAQLGNKTTCDTQVVADILYKIPRQYWRDILQFTDTRFAIINKSGRVERHGKWHKRDDIWYSKSDCFAKFQYYNTYGTYGGYSNWNSNDDTVDSFCDYADGDHLVAVYGTLKQGFGNHDFFLANSVPCGDGVTVNKYPLQIHNGLPYVHDNPNKGHQVSVEVYIVDDDELEQIDGLEGHPHHYQRKLVDIDMADGFTEQCYLYFSNEDYNPLEPMLQTY